MRISRLSTQPPAAPATRPIAPPMTTPEAMTSSAANQLVRMPKSTRREDVAADVVGAEQEAVVERRDAGAPTWTPARSGCTARATAPTIASTVTDEQQADADRSPHDTRASSDGPAGQHRGPGACAARPT